MADLNAALKKYSYGDGLSDEELAGVFALFERLEYDLGTLTRHYNAGFGLAYKTVMCELQILEKVRHARERE